MKKIILTIGLLMLGFWSSSLFSQTGTEPFALGLPGDNLFKRFGYFSKRKNNRGI
jgi:hypothetical protein